MRFAKSTTPLLAAAALAALPVGAQAAPGPAAAPTTPSVSPTTPATPASPAPTTPVDRDPGVARPTLVGRSTIPATLFLPGPISGTALGTTPVNGITAPFAGQPIPGFSGILRQPDGTILGLPDNGFGSKANSADYLLQLQYVTPNWKTAAPASGPKDSGDATIRKTVRLSDPWHLAGFPLARRDRELTGADFDIESIQPAGFGFHWIGDEFGPSVILVDPQGRLSSPPIPLPGVKSPASPKLREGETPTLPSSGGFEAMARMENGRYLLPITEKALTADPDPSRRVIHQLDALRQRYTGRTWDYRTDAPSGLVADAQALDRHRLLILERDDFEGPKAAVKKVYEVDLRVKLADGSLKKTLVADLLDLANPGVTQETPGVFGLGSPFRFALQSVESLLPVGRDQLWLASDNNFPGSNGRRAGTPDDTEMIQVQLPRRR